MWNELIAQKEKWIGGRLVDSDSDMPDLMETVLLDIRWEDHGGGPESFIEFVGQDFTCGGDRESVGLSPHSPPGSLRFSGPYGLEFTVYPKA